MTAFARRNPTVAEATNAFLATLDHAETAGAPRLRFHLRQLRLHLGSQRQISVRDHGGIGTALADWFTQRWDTRATGSRVTWSTMRLARRRTYA